jgi:hypothetical protein
VLTWLVEARSFTHQQQLTIDVAHLLAGEKSPARTPVAVAGNADDTREPVRSVPATAVLKKIDLCSEVAAVIVAPLRNVRSQKLAGERGNGTLRAAPPHGPPRRVAVT